MADHCPLELNDITAFPDPEWSSILKFSVGEEVPIPTFTLLPKTKLLL